MKCLSIWLFSFRAKANQLNVNFYGMRLNCFHCHYCLKPVFFQATRSMQIRFVKNTSIFLIRNTKSADQRYVHLKYVEKFCMLGYRNVLKWSSLSKRSLQLLNLKSVHNINDFAVVLMSPLPRFCGAFVSDRGYLLLTSFTSFTMISPLKILRRKNCAWKFDFPSWKYRYSTYMYMDLWYILFSVHFFHINWWVYVYISVFIFSCKQNKIDIIV